jgi:hypothetical protein
MQPVAAPTVLTLPPAATPGAPAAPVADPRAGGVQGLIGDAIRSSAAGYQTATRTSSVQAEKAAIHPFESVSTITGLLKDKTANIKGVGRATGLLHTIGGFALLIMSSNVTSSLKTPGDSAVDIANRVADLIDGRQTAEGWNLGWGVGRTGNQPVAPDPNFSMSAIGAAMAKSGVK